MNSSPSIYRGLKRAGIDFAASVPCINLQQLLTLVEEDPDIIHVPCLPAAGETLQLCAFMGRAGGDALYPGG